MKKKFLAIVMMSVLTFSVTACGGGVLNVVAESEGTLISRHV